MTSAKKITIYVDQETKDLYKQEAKDRNLSVSKYIQKLVEQQRAKEQRKNAVDDLDAEKRITDIIASGKDELKQVARHSEDVQARSAVYNIALWELQKQQYTDLQRKQALQTAAERLHDRLDEHPEFQQELDDALDAIEAEEDADGLSDLVK
ncbi:hypothetical protein [Haladaptatus sp. CMAA 1911]|uniref:hypothetical protein n=1 Tax=unclassified Haladaptatus TaxID=2622732 RepID=UPI0037553E1F